MPSLRRWPAECEDPEHGSPRQRCSAIAEGRGAGEAEWEAKERMQGNYRLPATEFDSRKTAK